MSFCDLSSNYTVARGRTYDLYKTQFFDFNRRSVPQRRRNPREDAGSIKGASPASEGTPKESAKSSVARGVSLASEGSPSAGTGAEKPKRKIHKAADKPAYRYAKVPLCMAQKFYGSRIPCKAQQLFGIPRKNMKPSKGYGKVFGERTTKDGKAAFFVRFLHVLQEKMTERKLNAVLEDEFLKDETVLEWLSASSPDTVTCKDIVRLGIRMQRQLTEEVSSSLYAVENFLEKVVVPKDRLIEENAELRMKLAEARAEIARLRSQRAESSGVAATFNKDPAMALYEGESLESRNLDDPEFGWEDAATTTLKGAASTGTGAGEALLSEEAPPASEASASTETVAEKNQAESSGTAASHPKAKDLKHHKEGDIYFPKRKRKLRCFSNLNGLEDKLCVCVFGQDQYGRKKGERIVGKIVSIDLNEKVAFVRLSESGAKLRAHLSKGNPLLLQQEYTPAGKVLKNRK